METVGFIIGGSLDGSVLSDDLMLERYQVFACPLLFGTEMQAALGKVTTLLHNLLLLGAPQTPKRLVKTVVTRHSRSEPSPCLAFASCSAPQRQSSRVCPIQTKDFSSHGHQQAIPGARSPTAWSRGTDLNTTCLFGWRHKWLYPSDIY